MPVDLLPLFGKCVLGLVVVGFVLKMIRPRAAIRIVIAPEGVKRHDGIAQSQAREIAEFFRQQVKVSSKVVVSGYRSSQGHLRFRFHGNLDARSRQRVRNFLLAEL